MKKELLTVLWMFLLASGALANKISDWKLQSQNAADGTATTLNEKMTLTRGRMGAKPYMLRAYSDVPVTPGTAYVLSYTVKVEGGGSAQGIIFSGNQQCKWDVKSLKYAEPKKKCDFTPVVTVITPSMDTYNLRLDLRAVGADTTVTYKDITLNKLGEKKDVVLSPSNSSVALDGKLDDQLWKDAVKLSPFRILGNIKQTSSLKNEVLLGIKDGDLYIGYRVEEPNPDGMKSLKVADAGAMQDTLGIYADDCVETFLSADQVSYAQIIVNAAGTKHWEQINVGKPNRTWYPSNAVNFAGQWEAKTYIGTNEWTCEKRIRISDIFGKNVGGEQTIFVNFTRHRTQGKEENLTWSPLSGQTFAAPKEFTAIKLNLPPVAGASDSQQAVSPVLTQPLTVPDLLLAGIPVKLTKSPGEFKLPASIQISEKNIAVDSGAKKMAEDALNVDGSGKAELLLNVKDVFNDPALTSAERENLNSPEAFKLELLPGKAVITGRTGDGVLRGIATLILMANRARFTPGSTLPALTLYDAPRMAFRGWLAGEYDPVAVKRMIDVAYLLRFNKILIMLDSFGGPTIFPFDCMPIGSRKSTKQDWIDVFNYARARGVEPIPYFSSWGRVQYLKNMQGGIKLLVDDVDVIQKGYRNLDVANPETHKVMLKLQEELIDALKPAGICIAMDETHYGNTVSSPAAKARNWKPSDWFVEAVNVNDAFLKRKGVKLYIYGDMLDPGYNGKQMDMTGPELLSRLPKDMIILDWKYDGKHEYSVDFPSVKMFKDNGLQVIGCPWFRVKNVPRLAYSVKRHNAGGMCLTSWNTTRIDQLKPELIRALALTAYYSWSPEDCELAHLKFVPDAVVGGAAYWNKVNFLAGELTSVKADKGLTGGNELVKMFGLPDGTDTTFIETPFKNYRGVKFDVFKKNGKPAAIAVAGGPENVTGEVKNGDFASGADMSGWQTENNGNGRFSIENGELKVTAPDGKAFMRIFQDIILDPKKEYVLCYKVKVAGPGVAKVWTYSGDEKFKWENSKIIYSNAKDKAWASKQVQLPPRHASVRICCSAEGTGSIAYFDDIELREKGMNIVKKTVVSEISIPVDAKARVITFMHATSRQDLAEDMAGMFAKFAKSIPGEYIITYADGSKARIQLSYRVNIASVNDTALGRDMDVGLFGTVGNTVFINLPTFTWVNHSPQKTIKSIEVVPGNSKDMTLLVFGIALE